jgi:DNA-binding SARP family transcriptional activator
MRGKRRYDRFLASSSLVFGLLGPLEVVAEGRGLPLQAPKQKTILALLLLHRGEVVSVDRLQEALWGEQPPATAATALQGYVSQLRRLLEAGEKGGSSLLVTRSPGYLLAAAPEQIDLARFEQVAENGRAVLTAGDAARAAALLAEALALWRGPPLADFSYDAWAQAPIGRLEELRLAALEERIEADLAAGRHSDLVGELQTLTDQNPLRERLRSQLMLALYRAGRQAEALAEYQETRRLLIDELGIEPSPVLQRLEKDILVQEPALDLASGEERQLLPEGQVTFIFTDIEGSTRLLQEFPEEYPGVLLRQRRLLRSAFRGCGGVEVDAHGDSAYFAFERALDAIVAAIAGQRAIAAETWPSQAPVRVRMGIHTGRPILVDQAYIGLDVHRAARLCAAAHGGQVVLSAETHKLLTDRLLDAGLLELGSYRLKDLAEPEHIFQLEIDGLPNEFPHLRTEQMGPARLPERSILVVPDPDRRQLNPLLALGRVLSGSRQPHELVVVGLVENPEKLAAAAAELERVRTALIGEEVPARVAAFTSSDRASDVIRLASRPEVDLVLRGGDARLVRDGAFGDELTAILTEAPCDVAILVVRDGAEDDLSGATPVVVPFGGAEHDWAAAELGGWLAGANGRSLVLVGTAADSETGRRDASRLLADAGLLIQRVSGVAPQPLLVPPGREGVIRAAGEGGLLVVGLSERWLQEGLGPTRWALARTASSPILFVRRGLRPGGLAPVTSATRFTWSLTEAGS